MSSLSINSRKLFNVTNNLKRRKNIPILPNLPKEIICSEFIKYVHDQSRIIGYRLPISGCDCINLKKKQLWK